MTENSSIEPQLIPSSSNIELVQLKAVDIELETVNNDIENLSIEPQVIVAELDPSPDIFWVLHSLAVDYSCRIMSWAHKF